MTLSTIKGQCGMLLLGLFCLAEYPTIAQSSDQFDQLYDRSRTFYEGEALDSALVYSMKMMQFLRISDEKPDYERRLEGYVLRSRILSKDNQFDVSMQILTEALTLIKRQSQVNPDDQFFIKCQIAHNHYMKNDLKSLQKDLNVLNEVELDSVNRSSFNQGFIKMLNGQERRLRNDIPAAVALFQESLARFRMSSDTTHAEMVRCINELGLCLNYQGEYDQAIKTFEYAIKKTLDISNRESINIGLIYNNIGLAHLYLENYQNAIESFEKNIEIISSIKGKFNPDLGPSYVNIGLVYSNYGLRQRAIYYLRLAEKTWKSAYGNDYPRLIYSYANLASQYAKMNMVEEGLHYVKLSEEIVNLHFGERHKFNALTLVLKAQLLAESDRNIEALRTAQKAREIFSNTPEGNRLFLIQTKIQEAQLLVELNRSDEAEQVLYDTYDECEQVFKGPNTNKSTIDYWLAKLFLQLKQHHRALDFNDRLLKNLDYNLSQNNYKNSLNLPDLMNGLRQRNTILKNINNGQVNADQMQINDKIIAVYSYALANLDDDEDKFLLKNNFRKSSENIFNDFYQSQKSDSSKNYMDQVHALMELNRNSSLLASLRINDQSLDYLVDKDLIDREDSLRSEMKRLQSLARNAKFGQVDSLRSSASWQDSLVHIQSSFDAVQKLIRKNHPRYYSMKYGTDIASVADIQESVIQSTDALLSYFWGSQAIYRLAITTDDVRFSKIVIDSTFIPELSQWLNYLKSPASDQAQVKEYAHEVFNVLFADSANLFDKVERITVVNDGEGNYIPFELLCYRTENDTLTYLVDKYNVSYKISTSLAFEHSKKRSVGQTKFHGYAAEYVLDTIDQINQSGSNLDQPVLHALPEAVRELETIHQLIGGKIFLNGYATESAFYEHADETNLLHLALHGELNDDYPMESGLMFNAKDTMNDGMLTAAEIYGLDLKMNLAVLSACESGLGRLRHGEGLMSIARAFRFAGVQSNVMSLWKIPDYSTSIIMENFYSFLKNGMNKDEALRLAKINYFNGVVEPQLKHPFYWAGFIIQGDTSPMRFKKNNNWRLILAGIILVFGILLGRRFAGNPSIG